jgi:hypothetical protein
MGTASSSAMSAEPALPVIPAKLWHNQRTPNKIVWALIIRNK